LGYDPDRSARRRRQNVDGLENGSSNGLHLGDRSDAARNEGALGRHEVLPASRSGGAVRMVDNLSRALFSEGVRGSLDRFPKVGLSSGLERVNYKPEKLLQGLALQKALDPAAESADGRQRSVVDSARGTAYRQCGRCRWDWSCLATAGPDCAGCASTCATCIAAPAKWACATCSSCARAGRPPGTRRCCKKAR